ncbi:hypothetical protein RCL1_004480 [Eukaryota sp. TZLM3-RCL]
MSDTRSLKIQTSVLRRLVRELEYYRQEAQDLEARVERLKESGADEHLINKQIEVLNESRQMIPDTVTRMETAWYSLKQVLDTFTEENPLFEGEEVQLAKHQLQLAEQYMSSTP